MAKKPLEIDMIAGSQLRDTQGEMLSVEGADITDLLNGKGRLNDNHGKGFFNSIGRVTEAKKIFKAEDCENDRHRYYWEKVKAPYIYVKGELYDDEDHMNAKAAAAILRNIHKKDVPLRLKASVEGGVISRGVKDESLLARTKIHSVAITFTPANQATLVEPLSLVKSSPEPGDEELIKSVIHLAEDNVPSFRHIVRHGSANKVHQNLRKISEMVKEIKGEGFELNIPEPHEILKSALEAKIAKNVNKIHQLFLEYKKGDLEKGAVKNAIAGAAAAGMMATANPAKAQEDKPKVTHEQVVSQLKDKNPNLWALAHVESSGGIDLDHKQIDNEKSLHVGHKAGGPWGLMPLTVQYIHRADKSLKSKYPELAEMTKDPETTKKNHSKITEFLKDNPQASLDHAQSLYNRLDKIHEGDKNKIAHSWYFGIKGTQNAIKSGKDIKSHDYVNKFNNLLEHGDKRGKKVEKALTAGYGGASAPTSRTHGAVLQSESFEDNEKPTKGFKYVVCDSCGNEQVYGKNQVKCRSCGKSWSFEKLFRYMK